jgi:ABC-type sugar transport system permease subunit
MPPREAASQPLSPTRYQAGLLALLAPAALGTVALVLVPALLSALLAFTRYDGVAPPAWNGLTNFQLLMADPRFAISIRNSLVYAALAVPLRVAGALLAALLLRPSWRGAGLYRAALYTPSVIPDVAYALIWLWIFNPLYGPLNHLLAGLGLPAPAWLVQPETAKPALAFMSLFQIGEGLVVMLAGLHSLPRVYSDLAAVDGAGRRQVLAFITLPLLAPWLALLTVRDLVLTFQTTFTPAYIMTGGNPYYATLFQPLLVYKEAFDSFRFGHGAAQTFMLFLVTAGLTGALLLFLRVSRLSPEGQPVSLEDEPPSPPARGLRQRPPSTADKARAAPGRRPTPQPLKHGSHRRRHRALASRLLWHLTCAALALLFTLPLYWMLTASLRPPGLPPPRTVEWLPQTLSLANYRAIFDLLPLGAYTLNSLVVAAAAVPATLLTASWAGFSLAQLPPRLGRPLAWLCLGVLMVPITALWLARFLLFAWLGLADSLLALAAPALMGTSPLFVLLFYWAFRRLPAEAFEAARLEGAGAFALWRRIALPLARPTVAAVAVLAFLAYWSDFINPTLLLKTPDHYTLAVGLRQLQQLDRSNWPLVLAGASVLTLPAVGLFWLVQRYFLADDGLAGGV